MPVPKSRRSSSRKRRNNSHMALKLKNLTNCPKCKKVALSHQLCNFCGSYGGKEIVKAKVKINKKK